MTRATRNEFHFTATRAVVYRALLDPHAVQAWRMPRGMTSVVHQIEAHEGGPASAVPRFAAIGVTTEPVGVHHLRPYPSAARQPAGIAARR